MNPDLLNKTHALQNQRNLPVFARNRAGTFHSAPIFFRTFPETNAREHDMADYAMRGQPLEDTTIEEDPSVEEEFCVTGEGTIIGCERSDGDWKYLVQLNAPRLIVGPQDDGIFWQKDRVGDFSPAHPLSSSRNYLYLPNFWREARMLPSRWRQEFWTRFGARLGCIEAAQQSGFKWDSRNDWYTDATGSGDHLCTDPTCDTSEGTIIPTPPHEQTF